MTYFGYIVHWMKIAKKGGDLMKEVRIPIMDLLDDNFKVREILGKEGFDLDKKIEKDVDTDSNEVVYSQNS